MTKGSVQHESISKIILNLYAPFNVEWKYTQQKMSEVKEINKPTVRAGSFNTTHWVTDKTIKHKMS